MRATWLGWSLGIPLVIVLALLGEAIGIGGAQVFVGAGMGAGVGLLQGRVVRDVLEARVPWALSCVVGISVPFLVVDVISAAGALVPYSLQLCVMVGGLVVGVWQARLLRPVVRGRAAWVVASTMGWTLAAGMVAVADATARAGQLQGLFGALVFLGMVALGGVVLGLVTGATLSRMVRAVEPASS